MGPFIALIWISKPDQMIGVLDAPQFYAPLMQQAITYGVVSDKQRKFPQTNPISFLCIWHDFLLAWRFVIDCIIVRSHPQWSQHVPSEYPIQEWRKMSTTFPMLRCWCNLPFSTIQCSASEWSKQWATTEMSLIIAPHFHRHRGTDVIPLVRVIQERSHME